MAKSFGENFLLFKENRIMTLKILVFKKFGIYWMYYIFKSIDLIIYIDEIIAVFNTKFQEIRKFYDVYPSSLFFIPMSFFSPSLLPIFLMFWGGFKFFLFLIKQAERRKFIRFKGFKLIYVLRHQY